MYYVGPIKEENFDISPLYAVTCMIISHSRGGGGSFELTSETNSMLTLLAYLERHSLPVLSDVVRILLCGVCTGHAGDEKGNQPPNVYPLHLFSTVFRLPQVTGAENLTLKMPLPNRPK